MMTIRENKSMTAPQPGGQERRSYSGYHPARVDEPYDFENDPVVKAMIEQRFVDAEANQVDADGLTPAERAAVEDELLDLELSVLEAELDLIED